MWLVCRVKHAYVICLFCASIAQCFMHAATVLICDGVVHFQLPKLTFLLAAVALSADIFVIKSKEWPCQKLSLGKVLISPLCGPWASRWINHEVCDTWTVSVSADLWSPSQPHSVTTLWPLPSYTACWQMHTGVSSLPKATAQWCRSTTWTRDL